MFNFNAENIKHSDLKEDPKINKILELASTNKLKKRIE